MLVSECAPQKNITSDPGAQLSLQNDPRSSWHGFKRFTFRFAPSTKMTKCTHATPSIHLVPGFSHITTCCTQQARLPSFSRAPAPHAYLSPRLLYSPRWIQHSNWFAVGVQVRLPLTVRHAHIEDVGGGALAVGVVEELLLASGFRLLYSRLAARVEQHGMGVGVCMVMAVQGSETLVGASC